VFCLSPRSPRSWTRRAMLGRPTHRPKPCVSDYRLSGWTGAMFLLRIMVGVVAPLESSVLWTGRHTADTQPLTSNVKRRSTTEPATPDSNTNSEPTAHRSHRHPLVVAAGDPHKRAHRRYEPAGAPQRPGLEVSDEVHRRLTVLGVSQRLHPDIEISARTDGIMSSNAVSRYTGTNPRVLAIPRVRARRSGSSRQRRQTPD
jgi:hypothetical protein